MIGDGVTKNTNSWTHPYGSSNERPTKANQAYKVNIPGILDDHVRLWTDEIPWEACPSLESFGQGRVVLDSLVRP